MKKVILLLFLSSLCFAVDNQYNPMIPYGFQDYDAHYLNGLSSSSIIAISTGLTPTPDLTNYIQRTDTITATGIWDFRKSVTVSSFTSYNNATFKGNAGFGALPYSTWQMRMVGDTPFTCEADTGIAGASPTAIFHVYAKAKQLNLLSGTTIYGASSNDLSEKTFWLDGSRGGAYFKGNVGIGAGPTSYKLEVTGGDAKIGGKTQTTNIGVNVAPFSTWRLAGQGTYPLYLANNAGTSVLAFYGDSLIAKYNNNTDLAGYTGNETGQTWLIDTSYGSGIFKGVTVSSVTFNPQSVIRSTTSAIATDTGLIITTNTVIDGNLKVTGRTFITMPYSSYYSSTTQTCSVINTTQTVTFDKTYGQHGDITYNYTTKCFTMARKGVYLFTFSAVPLGDVGKTLWIYPRVNDVDVPYSNSPWEFAANSTPKIMTVTYLLEMNANDRFCLIMYGDDTSCSIHAYQADTTPIAPATPSIILTINKMGEVQ